MLFQFFSRRPSFSKRWEGPSSWPPWKGPVDQSDLLIAQDKAGRACVFFYVLGVRCLGDRKHRRMPDKERECNLARRRLMSLGNPGQDPAAPGLGGRKIVVAEGAVGRYCHAVADTPGKDRMFDGQLSQVIKNLIAGNFFARLSYDPVNLLKVIGVEVADTPG